MPLELKIKEPILVKNPHTGRFINVAPLFDAIEQAGELPEGSTSGLKMKVSRIIRLVTLAWDGEPTEQKNVNYDLYLLEDMFEGMSEFKQG